MKILLLQKSSYLTRLLSLFFILFTSHFTFSQCGFVGSEPTLTSAISAPVCLNTAVGAGVGVGPGSRKIYSGFTAGQVVQLYINSQTAVVNCVQGRWLTAGGAAVSGWFTINYANGAPGTYTVQTVPATADRLEVTTGRTSWVATSALLNYRLRNPDAVSVTSGANICSGATLTASGGANGTMYWQGTTVNGTSTASPGTVSPPVTAAGTYFFGARDNVNTSCWTYGSTAVTIATGPTGVSAGSPQTVCSGGSVVLNGSATAPVGSLRIRFRAQSIGDEAAWRLVRVSDGAVLVSGGPYGNTSWQEHTGTYTVPVRLVLYSSTNNWCDNNPQWEVLCNNVLIGSGTASNYCSSPIVMDNINCSSSVTYAWSGGPIVSGGSTLTPTVNPSSTTVYTMTATASGCSVPSTVTVTVSNPTITGTPSACVGGTSDLGAGDPDWASLPTGGTITTTGTNDRIHRFTTGGTFSTPVAISGARVMVIGGGGSGGSNGGGGGAGGVYQNNNFAIASGPTTVTVGGPGALHPNNATAPTPGGQSAFGAITAGGGGGGASRDNGINGGGPGGTGTVNGSGGGGGGSEAAALRAAGIGVFNGGVGFGGGCNSAGGGGGGAGAVGGNAGSNVGGAGGSGIQSDITGSNLWYAAGGGGGTTNFNIGCGGASSCNGTPCASIINGSGANGIGGNGESTVGAANTGSGGGAERAGASGVVIVRYKQPKWVSSNTAIATVNELTGVVTGVAPGTVTITYYSPSGCTATTSFTVNAASTPPTSITGGGTYCHGVPVTLTQSGGSLASGASYEWFTGSCGGTAAGTGASISPTPAATTNYFVRVGANGGCPASACVSTTVTLPTAGTSLSGNETATCTVSGSNWIRFYGSTGNLIAAVNPNGRTGLITVQSFTGSVGSMLDCDLPTAEEYRTAYMGRNFIVSTSGLTGTGNVDVRFPFLDTELNALSTAAGTIVAPTGGTVSPANPNDNVTDRTNIGFTKYSNPGSEDGNPLNNCTGGTLTFLNQSGNGVMTGAPYNVPNSQYVQVSTATFSEFYLHGNGGGSPLPVKMISFSADCNSNSVQLNWSTASELNADRFIIERSRDMVQWSPIGEVQAAGNSNQTINYAFSDTDPISGTSYYRLRQVDFDGEEEFFVPISVDCANSSNSVKVYPNPTASAFTVEITSLNDAKNTTIQLTDVMGKVISSKSIDLTSGTNHVYFQETFESGTYLIRVLTATNEFETVKVVVKH